MGLKNPLLSGFSAMAALASLSFDAGAQGDEEFEPQNCIRAESIRSTEIIDDNTIIFYLPRNRIYRNELPNNCPRLAIAQRFMYERRVGQRVGRLCSIDSITVIDASQVPPYGATCRLGMFQPIDEADVTDLLTGSRPLVETVDIEVDEETEARDGVDATNGASETE